MELTSQQIRAILSLGQKLLEKGEVQDDFGESAAIVSQMDGESYDWAIDFLYKAPTVTKTAAKTARNMSASTRERFLFFI